MDESERRKAACRASLVAVTPFLLRKRLGRDAWRYGCSRRGFEAILGW